MKTSTPSTSSKTNLEAAFSGESMASRKYLFFAELAKQLGNRELEKFFRENAAKETDYAFAHFRLLHPELVIDEPEALSEEFKQVLLARCLELAIEGEVKELKAQRHDETEPSISADSEGIDDTSNHQSKAQLACLVG